MNTPDIRELLDRAIAILQRAGGSGASNDRDEARALIQQARDQMTGGTSADEASQGSGGGVAYTGERYSAAGDTYAGAGGQGGDFVATGINGTQHFLNYQPVSEEEFRKHLTKRG